jgi:hypothetical protein
MPTAGKRTKGSMIDKALDGTTFFRLVISSDRKLEDRNKDLNLQELTEQTMMQLQSILALGHF